MLKASAQGLTFEPEEPGSKDAFIFAYRDFVHDLDGETLVLKTSDRTFRFQPINSKGKRDSGELSALHATLKAATLSGRVVNVRRVLEANQGESVMSLGGVTTAAKPSRPNFRRRCLAHDARPQ